MAVLISVLHGLGQVARREPGAERWSYAIAALGVFTFTLHAVILALGNDDFRSATSLALLLAILGVAVAQALATRRVTTS